MASQLSRHGDEILVDIPDAQRTSAADRLLNFYICDYGLQLWGQLVPQLQPMVEAPTGWPTENTLQRSDTPPRPKRPLRVYLDDLRQSFQGA